MNWLKSNRYILLLMLATVLVRLPNLNRPLSKHHEFNPAVMLINAHSWEQGGGASKFGFTPLMNFQGYGNKVWESGPHIDAVHNHLYLSYGSAAFVLPYLFFKAFHLPISPLWLQLLNLLFSIWGIWLFYRLILSVTGDKDNAVKASCLFALLPSVLWYTGNGYVNTAIMLPFTILILMTWHRLEMQQGKIGLQAAWLFLLLVALTWIDWYSFFLGGAIIVWALPKTRRSKRYFGMALFVGLSVAAGIFLVLYQLSIYSGWDQVLEYWRSRFADRSTDTSRFSFTQMLLMCGKNLVTGYLPALVLLPFAIFRKKVGNTTISWPIWALLSVIPYNGLFFNWSAEHEFAWLAFGLMATIFIALYLLPAIRSSLKPSIILLAVVVSIGIYYFINRPGTKSWKGDVYDSQMQLGRWIHSHVDANRPLFSNLANDRIVEYYSKRTFNSVRDKNEAIKVCLKYRISSATWLEIKNNKVVKQVLIMM